MNPTTSFRASDKSKAILDEEMKNPNQTITDFLNELIESNPRELAYELQETKFKMARALTDSLQNHKRADELNLEVGNLRNQIANQQDSKMEIASLKNQLKAFELELQGKEEENARIQDENSDLCSDLHNHKSKLDILKKTNLSLQESTKTDNLEEEIQNLKEELKSCKSQRDSYENNLSEYETEELEDVFEMAYPNTFTTDADGREFDIESKQDLVEMLVHQFRLHLEEMQEEEESL